MMRCCACWIKQLLAHSNLLANQTNDQKAFPSKQNRKRVFLGHDPCLLPCSHGMLQDEYATFEGTAGLRVVQKKPISSSLKAKAVVLGFLLLAIGAFVGQKASQALAEPLELTDVAEGTILLFMMPAS